ncbi:MAG: nucleotidyltransferase domain-containing protein, partial [Casimicrobium sp.]
LEPLLFKILESTSLANSSQHEFAALWVSYEANAAKNRRAEAELLRIAEVLHELNIDFVAHKGPALTRALYGDPALRVYGDLDLLLRSEQVFHAADALAALGYRPLTEVAPNHRAAFLRAGRQYDLELSHVDTGAHLELHWRTDAQYFVERIDDAAWWKCLDTVAIGAYVVNQLAPMELMFALLIHGTKHQWERLAWLVDILLLAKNLNREDWLALHAAARAKRCEIRILFGLRLAERLFARRLDGDLEWRAAAEAQAANIVDATVAELCASNVEGEYPRTLWHSISRDMRCNDTVSQSIGYVARLVFTPNHHDWRHVGNHPAARLLAFPARMSRKLFGREA